MDSLESSDNIFSSVIIPKLEEQNAKLEEEIELAKKQAFKAEAEYITKQQELEDFHSDPVHIKFSCFSGSYESELNNATELVQKSKIEYEADIRNLVEILS